MSPETGHRPNPTHLTERGIALGGRSEAHSPQRGPIGSWAGATHAAVGLGRDRAILRVVELAVCAEGFAVDNLWHGVLGTRYIHLEQNQPCVSLRTLSRSGNDGALVTRRYCLHAMGYVYFRCFSQLMSDPDQSADPLFDCI